MNKSLYDVKAISRHHCTPFILDIHYAGRWPSISYAYGLYEKDELVGVVTYGTPSSPTLRAGIAGKEYSYDVLELNRLCLLNNKPNEASYLVSRSLKMLPKNKIIVSFADSSQKHVGFVYQACNFLYSGLSAKRTDMRIKGKEHLHSTTITDEFRGVPNRAKAIREKYGDLVYMAQRPRKHRYLYITGTRRYKKEVLECLKYPLKPYVKE